MRDRRLWISHRGEVVCETEECAGPEFVETVRSIQNLTRTRQVGEERYDILNDSDIQEFGGLATPSAPFGCKCGRVTYDAHARTLVVATNKPSLYT